MENSFVQKDKCCCYVPCNILNDELFLVELLDICESYLEPLKYGISKMDIVDYIENYNSTTLYEFLHYKHFLSTKDDFIDVCFRYHGGTNKDIAECIRISFENVDYSQVEMFFANNPIGTLKKLSYENSTECKIDMGVINKRGEFMCHG